MCLCGRLLRERERERERGGSYNHHNSCVVLVVLSATLDHYANANLIYSPRSNPKEGLRVVNMVSGKPTAVANLLDIKGSCITPEKSSYPPTSMFHTQTKAATDVVAKTSLPIFL
jgi:hypothetical protein